MKPASRIPEAAAGMRRVQAVGRAQSLQTNRSGESEHDTSGVLMIGLADDGDMKPGPELLKNCMVAWRGLRHGPASRHLFIEWWIVQRRRRPTNAFEKTNKGDPNDVIVYRRFVRLTSLSKRCTWCSKTRRLIGPARWGMSTGELLWSRTPYACERRSIMASCDASSSFSAGSLPGSDQSCGRIRADLSRVRPRGVPASGARAAARVHHQAW